MRRLECARPPRTAIGQARNAGEAVQQLAHLARERQRLVQEHGAVMRRIRKIDARLRVIAAAEHRLLPMLQGEKTRAPAAKPAPKRQAVAPAAANEVTLQY
jgi:hypothetical protein